MRPTRISGLAQADVLPSPQ